MIKKWKVSGELNMDASKYGEVFVYVNTLKKAYKIGEGELKKKYNAFYVTNLKVEEVKEDGQ